MSKLKRMQKMNMIPGRGGLRSPLPPAPPGAPQGEKIPIDEADYWRFRYTKLMQENLTLKSQKVEGDKQIVELSQRVVNLEGQLLQREIKDVYRDIGIEDGDQIVGHVDSGEYFITRPKGAAPRPVGAPPLPASLPSLPIPAAPALPATPPIPEPVSGEGLDGEGGEGDEEIPPASPSPEAPES